MTEEEIAEANALVFASHGNLAKPFQSSPLHGASRRGYADVVNVLLANGADATVRDYNGKTPPELATAPDVRAVFARYGIATS